MITDEVMRKIEMIVIRRLHESRLDGYTKETAEEIAEAVAPMLVPSDEKILDGCLIAMQTAQYQRGVPDGIMERLRELALSLQLEESDKEIFRRHYGIEILNILDESPTPPNTTRPND